MILILIDEETDAKVVIDSKVDERHHRSRHFAESVCNDIAIAVDAAKVMPKHSYDPIGDEKKLYNLRQFEAIMINSIVKYADTFDDANEWQRGEHTFSEWVSSFFRWMSW